jgi:hypothetical protein
MTEVIYSNKLKMNRPKDQIILNKYHYVEMKSFESLPIYQFNLHPHSNLNGAYVLIKDNSKILKQTDAPVEHFKTQILNITKKEQGPFKGHFKVALSIED